MPPLPTSTEKPLRVQGYYRTLMNACMVPLFCADGGGQIGQEAE